ncbi:hypothetical protein P154DRAFT_520434 [Amniculicola lignicola CBS 123094]|uniref:Uncharacterized protein n=1 Tax=Amniculicola lignicola CBS 123094 TaxID=1392246 RepID=A0A6A5WNH5_9PLEO|nr:hypothetical protein P154DRAFT_520434 [Amniculicola lignicola CBS 123094]
MSGGRTPSWGGPRAPPPHTLATSDNELNTRSPSAFNNGNNYVSSPRALNTSTHRPTDMSNRKRSIPSEARGNSPPHPYKRHSRSDSTGDGTEDVSTARGPAQNPRHNGIYGRREPPGRSFSGANASMRKGSADNRSPSSASPITTPAHAELFHSGSGGSTPVRMAPTAPPMMPAAPSQSMNSTINNIKAPNPLRSLITAVAYDITSREATVATDRLSEERSACGGSITLESVKQMRARKLSIAKKAKDECVIRSENAMEEGGKTALTKAQAGQSAKTAMPINNAPLATSNDTNVEGSSELRKVKSGIDQAEVKALQICVKQLQVKQLSYDEQATRQLATQKSVADLQAAVEQQKQSLEAYVGEELKRHFEQSKGELNKQLEDNTQQRSESLKVALNKYIDAEVQRRCEDSQKALADVIEAKVQQRTEQEVAIIKQILKQELQTHFDEQIEAENVAAGDRLSSAINTNLDGQFRVRFDSAIAQKIQSDEDRFSQLEDTAKLINGEDTSIQAQIKSMKAQITSLDTANIKGPAVKKLLSNYQVKVEANQTELNLLKGEMLQMKTTFQTLRSGNFGKEIADLKSSIQSIQKELSSTAAVSTPSNLDIHNLAKLEPRMASCEGRLDKIQGDLKTLDDALTEVEERQGADNSLETLSTQVSAYVKDFLSKKLDPLQKFTDERFEQMTTNLRTTSDNVEQLFTNTIPALRQEQALLQQGGAANGAAIQALSTELERTAGRAKNMVQGVTNRLDINTVALKSLEDRWQNINTDDIYHRIVNEVMSKYPNTQAMLERLGNVEQSWNTLGNRAITLEAESRQLSDSMSNLSEVVTDQMQHLGQAKTRITTLEQLANKPKDQDTPSAEIEGKLRNLEGSVSGLQKIQAASGSVVLTLRNDLDTEKTERCNLDARVANLQQNVTQLEKSHSDKLVEAENKLRADLQSTKTELRSDITKEHESREVREKELHGKIAAQNVVINATMLLSAKHHKVIQDINENLPIPLPSLDMESFITPDRLD